METLREFACISQTGRGSREKGLLGTLLKSFAKCHTNGIYICVYRQGSKSSSFHSTPLLPERLSLQVESCLSVCPYVITSVFPIWGLQIIPESCQISHIKHHCKEDDISHDNDKDTQKDKYEQQRQRQRLIQNA